VGIGRICSMRSLALIESSLSAHDFFASA
jgi:hypothetical protein